MKLQPWKIWIALRLLFCVGLIFIVINLCCQKTIYEEEVLFIGEVIKVESHNPGWGGLTYNVTFENSMEMVIDVEYRDFPVVGNKYKLIKIEDQHGKIKGYCVRKIY